MVNFATYTQTGLKSNFYNLLKRFILLLLCAWGMGDAQHANGQSCGGTTTFTVPDSICSGTTQSVSFSVTGATITSYKVIFGDGVDSTVTAAGSINHIYTQTGWLYLKLIRTGAACKDTLKDSIFVKVSPDAFYKYSNDTACDQEVILFTDTSHFGSTISWKFGNGNSATASPSNQKFTNKGTTIVAMSNKLVVVAASGCKDSISKNIYIKPAASALYKFTSDSICSGSSIQFNDTSKLTGQTFLWEFNDTSNGSSSTSNSANPAHIFNNAVGNGYSSYAVKLKATNAFKCTDSVTKTLYIKQRPNGSIFDATGNAKAFTWCDTADYDLQIDGSSTTAFTDSTNTIDWGDSSKIDTVTGSFGSQFHTYKKKGYFYLKVKTTGKNQCTYSSTYTVFKGTNPAVSIGNPGSTTGLCAPLTLKFPINGASINPPGTIYTVSSNDGSSDQIFNHPPPDTVFWNYTKSSCGYTDLFGTSNAFHIKIVASNPCNITPASAGNITFSKSPKADFSFPKDTICLNYTTTFTSNTTLGSDVSSSCNATARILWKLSPSDTSKYQIISGKFGDSTNWTSSSLTWGSSSLQLKFKDTGTYYLKLVVANKSGACGFDSVIKKIVVVSPPQAAFAMSADSGCKPLAVAFTNQSTGVGLTYKWIITPSTGFAYTNSTADTSIHPKINITSAGFYYIQLITQNACTTDTAYDTLKVKTVPTVAVNSVSDGCKTYIFTPVATVNAGFGTISNYLWKCTGGSPSSASTLNPGALTYNVAGTYSIKLTATNECGIGTDSESFTVNTPPSVSVGANDSVCINGNNISLNGSPTGGTWTGTGISGNIFYPLTAGVGNFVLKYVYKSTTTQCKDSATQTIKVYPKPSADFSFTTVCRDDSTVFTNNSTISSGSNSSWNWTFGDGGSSAAQHPKHLYISSGSYSVRLITFSSLGCSDTITKTVTVRNRPKAIFGASQVCKGSTTIFTDTSTFITAFNKGWSWSFGDASTSSLQNPTHLYSASGTYSVRLIVTDNNGCVDSVKHNVNVSTSPTAKFGYTSGCVNKSTSFYDSSTVSVGSVNSWKWDFGDGGTSSLQNPTHIYTSAASYTVKLVAGSGTGCADSIIKTVVVYPKPNPVFSFGSTNFCAPASFTVSNTTSTISPTIASWKWRIASASSVVISNDTAKNPAFSFADNQSGNDSTYTIQLIVTSTNGCIDTAFQNMVSYTRPKANYILPDTGCSGFSGTVNNTSTSGYSWNWFSTPSVTIDNDTSKNPIYTFLHNYTTSVSSYLTMLVAKTIHNCVDTAQKSVYVLPRPLANCTVNAVDSCQPLTVYFHNTSSPRNGGATSNMTFQWAFGNGNTSVAADTNILYTNTGQTDSIYTVQLLATANNGCIDDSAFQITVYPHAKADLIISTSSSCAPFILDTNVVKAKKYTSANATYRWYINDTLRAITSAFPGDTIQNAGDSSIIKLVVYSGKGCKPDSIIQVFKTISNPQPAFTLSDTAGCQPLKVNFTDASIPSSGLGYQWNFGNGQTSSVQNPTNILFTNTGTTDTIYTIKLIAFAGSGCKDSIIHSVKVHPKPDAQFAIVASKCAPANVSVTNSTAATPSISAWAWSVDSCPWISISNKAVKSPSFAFADNQSGSDSAYTIRLVATTAFNCKDTSTQQINIYTRPIAVFAIKDSSCGPLTIQPVDSSKYATAYTWSAQPALTINNSSTVSPTYIFSENFSAADRSYTSKLVVASTHTCLDSAVHTTIIHPRPLASFNLSRVDTCSPVNIHLTNTSQPFNGQSIDTLKFTWNIENGITSYTKDTSIYFVQSGVNDSVVHITLAVMSPYGCVDDSMRAITLRPNAKAAFTYTNTSGCAPFVIDGSNIQASVFANANSMYKWYAHDSLIGSVSTFPSYTMNNAGDSVEIKLVCISKNGCKNDSQSVWFHTISNPAPSFSISDTVGCHPLIINFNNTSTPAGLGTYWYFGNGQTSLLTAPTNIQFTNTGNTDSIYTIKLVVTAGSGCQDSITRFITVKPLPNPSFNLSKDSLCMPKKLTVSNTSSNTPAIGVYTWKAPVSVGASIQNDTASISTQISFADNQTGNFRYESIRLIAKSSFGCVDSSDKILVIPTRPQAIFIPSSDSTCGPASISISNTSANAVGYQWFSAHGNLAFSNKTIAAPSIALPENKGLADSSYQVRLVVTSLYQCVDTAYKNVYIHPRPKTQFVADSTNSCGPILVTFSNSSFGNTSLSYQWNLGDGSTDTSTAPTHTYYPAAFNDTIYTIRLISKTLYGCADTLQTNINVKPGAVASIFSNDTIVCTPASVFIQNKSYGNVDTFSWDFDDGQTLVTASDSDLTHSFTQEGIYYIHIKAANECKTTGDSFRVTAYEVPHTHFVKSDSINCGPITISFTNTTSNVLIGAIQWLWDFDNGQTSVLKNPPPITFPKNTSGKDSVYIIKLRGINICDTFLYSDSIKVRTHPIAAFTPDKQTGCSPFNAKFTNHSKGADSTRGAGNYMVWNWGDGSPADTVRNTAKKSHIYSVGQTDTFTIKLWVYNECGVDSQNHDIIVYPNDIIPFVALSPANGMGCNPLTVSFTNNTTGANTYFWQFDSANTSNSKNASWTFTKADSYSVAMTASNACTDTTIYISIKVFDPPIASFLVPLALYCDTGTIQFSNTSTGATGYVWQFGDGQSATGTNPTHFFDSAGVYKILLTAQYNNSSGLSCTDTFSRTISIYKKPIGKIGSDTFEGCEPLLLNVSASNSLYASTYKWSFGDGAAGSLNINPSTHIYRAGMADTSYTLQLVVGNAAGCYDTTTKQVDIYKKPVTNFAINAHFGCFPDTLIISNNSSSNLSSALWSYGDGQTSNLVNPSNHIYTRPGNYIINMLGQSSYGCKDTASDTIKVGGNDSMYIQCADTNICGYDTAKFKCSQVNAASVFWDFGDGQSGSGLKVSHVYINGGNYSAIMVMTGSDGCIDSAVKSIAVRPRPQVSWSVDDSDQCENDNIFTFTNASTISSGSVTHFWDFGNGSTTTLIDRAEVYNSTGNYRVKLIETSNLGCADSVSKTMYVRPKPNPVFVVNDTSQCVNNGNYIFTNSSNVAYGTFLSQWQFGDGNVSSTKSPSHAYTVAGTYNVQMRVTSNYGCRDSVLHQVLVFHKPDPAFTIDDSGQCLNGNNYTFTDGSNIGSGTFTSLWNYGDGNTSTSVNASHVYTTADTFYIKLKLTSNYGCVDSAIKQVAVYPKPTPAFGINKTDQCINAQSIIYTNGSSISSGNFSSLWSFGDGNSSAQNNATHIYADTGSYITKLVVTSSFDCKDSIEHSLMIRPKPVPDFAIFDTDQCVTGNIFQFTNGSNIHYGQLNYLWSFGDGKTDTSSSTSHTYQAHGTYQVKLKVYSDRGCVDSLTKTVIVRPKPKSNFTINDSDQCENIQNFVVTQAATVPYGSLTYDWDFGDGTVYSGAAPSSKVYSVSGVYPVQLAVASNYGCLDTFTRSIIVFDVPKAAFNINDSTQCVNAQDFKFTNQSSIPIGSLNYIWSFGDGLNSLAIDTSHIYQNYNDYTIWLKAISDKQCKDSVSHQIRVYPKPHSAFAANDSDQCVNGNNFQYTNQSTVPYGFNLYLWRLGDGDTSLNTHVASHQYKVYGNYQVQLFAISNNGCFDTSEKTMIVYPKPIPSFSIDDSFQCINSNIFRFTSTSTNGYGTMSHQWSFGDNSTSLLPSPSHSYSKTGIYQIQMVSTSDHSCADSIIRSVVVNQKPKAEYTMNDTDNCNVLNVQFTDQSYGAVRWWWNYKDPASTLADTTQNGQHQYILPGTFWPQLIIQNAEECYDTVNHPVYIYPDPFASFSMNPPAGCDTPVHVQFTNQSTGAINYIWDFGNGKTSTLNNPQTIYTNTQDYPIILTAFSDHGCADSQVITYLVRPQPKADFVYDPDSGCMPLAVGFNNLSRRGVTYRWDFGEGSISDKFSPTFNYTIAGSFTPALRVENGGCVDTYTGKPIEVWQKPIAGFTIDRLDTDSFTFTNTSLYASKYIWFMGNDSFSFAQHIPDYSYHHEGTYQVSLFAITDKGCKDTARQTVVVQPSRSIWVPNAFTPNGDQLNDVFKVEAEAAISFDLTIYNRWGEIIFHTNDIKQGWDGTFRGRPCQEEAYLYQFSIVTQLDGRTAKHSYKGIVGLIR
jgi:gliding motility-associated-like protein